MKRKEMEALDKKIIRLQTKLVIFNNMRRKINWGEVDLIYFIERCAEVIAECLELGDQRQKIEQALSVIKRTATEMLICEKKSRKLLGWTSYDIRMYDIKIMDEIKELRRNLAANKNKSYKEKNKKMIYCIKCKRIIKHRIYKYISRPLAFVSEEATYFGLKCPKCGNKVTEYDLYWIGSEV